MRNGRRLAALVALPLLVWAGAIWLRAEMEPVATERGTGDEVRPAAPARILEGAVHDTPSGRQEFHGTSEPAAGLQAATAEVVLRSAHGLRLWDTALRALHDPEWTRADVAAHATVAVPATSHPREVQARGHTTALVPTGPGQVTLEAGALFELRLPGGARTTWRTSSVGGNRSMWWFPFCVADEVDGVWRAAVDPTAAASDERLRPPLELEVDVGTGWRVRAAWSLNAGDRVVEELPPECAAPPPFSVLQARAVGGDAEPSRLVWDLAIDPAFGPADHPLDGVVLQRSWGTLRLSRSLETTVDGELARDGRLVRLDGAVVGARYHVRVATDDRRWIGRALVVCDDDPEQAVDVPLEPGRSLSGCLVDARTGDAIAHREVTARVRYGGSTCEGWGCLWNERSVLRPRDDGCFSFPACGFPPAMVGAPWPAPRMLAVEISVDGYQAWTRDVAWEGDVAQSLGTILLEPLPPDLRLRLTGEGLDTGEAFLHLAGADVYDSVSVDIVDFETAGLWCDPRHRTAFPARLEGVHSMLVEQDRGGPDWLFAGFTRSSSSDLWYELPAVRYAFDVRIAEPLAEDEHLRAGLEWRGVRSRFEDLPRSEARRFGFSRDLWGPAGAVLWVEARDADGEIVRRVTERLAETTTVVSF